jgi:Domain of unknown function (DUF1906)
MRRARLFVFPMLLCGLAVLLALPNLSRTQTRQSTFLGFDLNDYPGDDGLPVLRKTFSFTGYWLNAPPGEKESTWLGTRPKLQAQGFGFVVLFNGRDSRNLKSVPDAIRKGESDAADAAVLARHEGFPPGTIIFLDVEEGGRLTPAYYEYVNAWIDGLAKANFRGGAYCSAVPVSEGDGQSITTFKDIQDHLGGRKLVVWVFNDACPPSPGCVFPKTPPAITQSGSSDAALWQFAQSPRNKPRTVRCAGTYNRDGNCYAPGDTAHKWFLDIDTATSANPSGPRE